MTMASTSEATVDVGQGLYVYGIVPATTALEDQETGLGMGSPVRVVVEGPVAAVVETVDVDRPLGRRRDLVAHSAVLNALAARGPVLPMRFGSVVTDEATVREELLRPQQEHFVGLLEQVAGKVQLTLRGRYVLDTVLAEVVAADPQVATLRERTAGLSEEESYYDRIRLGELVAQAVDARRERDAESIVAALAPHVEDYVLRETSGMDGLVELAMLVASDDVARLEQAAESVAEAFAGRAELNLVGPTALYDFVPEQ